MRKMLALAGLLLLLGSADALAAERVYKAPLTKLNERQLHREAQHARFFLRFMRYHRVARYDTAFRHRTCFTVVRDRRGLCFYLRRQVRERERLLRRLETMLRPPAPVYAVSGVWAALASCESGQNWSYNGGSGFDGGLQFHPGTWSAYRLPGYPAYAYQASAAQQVAVAERVLATQGWSAWPACSAKLGLR